jgi:hypothetical protein
MLVNERHRFGVIRHNIILHLSRVRRICKEGAFLQVAFHVLAQLCSPLCEPEEEQIQVAGKERLGNVEEDGTYHQDVLGILALFLFIETRILIHEMITNTFDQCSRVMLKLKRVWVGLDQEGLQ